MEDTCLQTEENIESSLTVEELKGYLKLSLELQKLNMEMMNNMMNLLNDIFSKLEYRETI